MFTSIMKVIIEFWLTCPWLVYFISKFSKQNAKAILYLLIIPVWGILVRLYLDHEPSSYDDTKDHYDLSDPLFPGLPNS